MEFETVSLAGATEGFAGEASAKYSGDYPSSNQWRLSIK
jgi:hypothetical protein